MNDSGDAARGAPLIAIANHLNGNDEGRVASFNDEPEENYTLPKAIKALPIREVEGQLNLSFQAMFPTCLTSCEIVNVDIDDKVVTLSIRLS